MDVNLTPTIRYWDMEAPRIAAHLQEIKQSGLNSVGAWVPWAHLESDRRQSLRKFLKQAAQFGLKARLVVTPEVGVGYANGGIPEDLLRKVENLARDRTGQTIYSCSPPNVHPLVNLNSPPVFQRYGHFLLRLAQEIQEAIEENFESKIELVVGDSFFKHYRTAGLPPEDHGDFSPLFLQRELDFMQGWTPAQAERTFCVRALDFLAQRFERSREVSVSGRNFFMRGASLERLVEEIAGAEPDPARIFQELRLARPRCDGVWLEGLAALAPKERSFLVSAALAFYGDLWLPIEDCLATSQSFRQRMGQLRESLSSEDSRYERPVLAIVQNRFAPARLTHALRAKLEGALQLRSSMIDLKAEELRRIRIMVVEEALLIEYEQFQALVRRAREDGATIAFFRSSLCKRAQAEMNLFDKFKFNHGWRYEVTLFPGGGHILVVDGQEHGGVSMDTLAERLLAVGGVEKWCTMSDACVSRMTFDPQTAVIGGQALRERIIFFANPSDEERRVKMSFTRGLRFEGMRLARAEGATPDPLEAEEMEATIPALALVPPRVFFPQEEQLGFASSDLPAANEEIGKPGASDGIREQLA